LCCSPSSPLSLSFFLALYCFSTITEGALRDLKRVSQLEELIAARTPLLASLSEKEEKDLPFTIYGE